MRGRQRLRAEQHALPGQLVAEAQHALVQYASFGLGARGPLADGLVDQQHE
jgi:hypothetical protein